MWLPVVVWLLAVGGTAGSSELCRPPPAPEPDVEHVTAVEGSVARLACRLDARRATTSWTKLGRRRSRLVALGMGELAHIDQRPGSDRIRLGRRLVSRRRPWPQWILVIGPVTVADAGLYRCFAMYERPELEDSRHMVRLSVVPAGGARLAGPRRRAVAAGNPLTLSCTGQPPFSWQLDGRQTPEAADVSEGSGCSQLRLDAITAEDAGVYMCNDASGQAADSVHVTVVTKVATVVEIGQEHSDACVIHNSCDVLVIMALCYHLWVIKWTHSI